MVVAEVLGQNAAQMVLAQHDHVVEALAADGSDDALDVWGLPGRTECDEPLLDPHVLHPILEVPAVDAVAVSQQKTRSLFERKGLHDLLSGPPSGWAGRDTEVNHPATVVPEDQQDVEHSERDRRNREGIYRRDLTDVVGQEGAPSLGRWLRLTGHVLGDRGLGHGMAQQEQLRDDPRGAPRRVFPGHAADQVANLAVDLGSAELLAGPPPPVAPEALTMPADHRGRLDDQQGRLPARPYPRQPRPQDPVAPAGAEPLDGTLQYAESVTQGHVLGGQRRAAAEQHSQERQDQP
jgi:hypothetical protein